MTLVPKLGLTRLAAALLLLLIITVHLHTNAASKLSLPPLSLPYPDGLTIIIAYSLSEKACISHDRAPYIQFSLEHLSLIQTNSNILFVSDTKACEEKNLMAESFRVTMPPGVQYVDITPFLYNNSRVEEFKLHSSKALSSEYLWISSALRFFVIEEVMKEYSIRNVIHIEIDNLLYGVLSEALPVLQSGYKGLSATPLYTGANIITASVMWIPDHETLHNLTVFMTDCLGRDDALFQGYLKWMRTVSCCKLGGFNPDSKGMGIYNRSINEMTVLGYYRHLDPTKLVNFPILPLFNFPKSARTDLNDYRMWGGQAGPMVGYGIWLVLLLKCILLNLRWLGVLVVFFIFFCFYILMLYFSFSFSFSFPFSFGNLL